MSEYTVTTSAELMENYLQADFLLPQEKFAALQTDAGASLLFSIGTGGVFHLTMEVPGETSGWREVNLGAAQIMADYPGQATVKTFGAAQAMSPAPGAASQIHLGMVVNDGTNDHLYLSLENSGSDLGWAQRPIWTPVPFNAVNSDNTPVTPPSPLHIVNVLIGEATDREYIVVDIVRNPGQNADFITRYYIDTSTGSAPKWTPHDLAADVQAASADSCLGRSGGGRSGRASRVDGIYTKGFVGPSAQLFYTPVYNVFDETMPAPPSRLNLPDGMVPDTIAAARNADNTSDLYVAARGRLYRFASDNQRDGATGALVVTSPLLASVRNLYASTADGSITVWGLNSDNEVFYLTCPLGQQQTPAAWNVPLTILSGVDAISPFIDRDYSANTFFAHSGTALIKAVKSPGTGAWTRHGVTLPPAKVTTPAHKFSSYTTRIQVVDDYNQPAAGVRIALSASNVTSVYIDHLYYRVGPSEIHATTDATGCVTIVEAASGLTGTTFSISAIGDTATATTINPMDNTVKKATALQSVDQLKGAQITSYANGQKLPPRKLIRSDVDDRTLQQVANLNKQLALVYANPQQKPPSAPIAAMAEPPAPAFAVPADAPRVDSGDLFQLLEAMTAPIASAVDPNAEGLPEGWSWVVPFVRWFEDAWEFVVEIAGLVYRCVLEFVEDIVAAVRWVYEKIVTSINDLIEFLQYLFEWDDFKRTKDVLKNLATVFLNHEIEQIPLMRQRFDQQMDELVKAIDSWAGLPGLSGLGDAGSGRLSSQATADGPDAPGALLSHHLQGNAANAVHRDDPANPPPPTGFLDALNQAMEREKETLGDAFGQLQQLMLRAAGLSLTAILQQLAAILADAVLRSAQVVMDALFDILHLLATKVLELLDTPVHIPVISDILNDAGIADFSMLDAICWVAAIPVTIAYKVAMAASGRGHQAPFPDDEVTTFLATSKDFNEIAAAFNTPTLPDRAEDAPLAAAGPIDIMSDLRTRQVFSLLHGASGVCAFLSARVDYQESLIPTKAVPTGLTLEAVAAAIAGGGTRAMANALIPRHPIDNEITLNTSRLVTLLFLWNKGVFGLYGFGQAASPVDYRFVGAVVDAVLVIPALVVTILHFVELGGKPASQERTVAILDETSFVATYAARVLYTAVVSGLLGAQLKPEAAGAMGVAQAVHGALQFSESVLVWF